MMHASNFFESRVKLTSGTGKSELSIMFSDFIDIVYVLVGINNSFFSFFIDFTFFLHHRFHSSHKQKTRLIRDS